MKLEEVFKCHYCGESIYPEENRTKPAKKFCRNTRCAVYYCQYELQIRKLVETSQNNLDFGKMREQIFCELIRDTKSVQETVCLTFGKPVEDVFTLTKRFLQHKVKV